MVDRLAYSKSEAMAATGLGRTALEKLIAEGKVETRRAGSRVVIPAHSLKSWLAPADKSAA